MNSSLLYCTLYIFNDFKQQELGAQVWNDYIISNLWTQLQIKDVS